MHTPRILSDEEIQELKDLFNDFANQSGDYDSDSHSDTENDIDTSGLDSEDIFKKHKKSLCRI